MTDLNKLRDEINEKGCTVFYHAADNDGRASGYLVRDMFPSANCVPVNHNKPPRWDLVLPGCVIFCVDFSFELETMIHLNKYHHLIWIDHHDPILTFPQQSVELANVDGLRAIEPRRSGVKLVWEYLHGDEKPPRVIQLISDYDTWVFEDKDVLPFSYATGLMDLTPDKKNDDLWNKLMLSDKFVDKIIAAGNHIQEYIDLRAKIVSDNFAFESEIEGNKIATVNMKNCNSKILDPFGKPDHCFRLLFSYFGNIKKYRCGIYSEDDTKYSASEIARKYNGDGRSSAAGFVINVDEIPIVFPKTNFKEISKEVNMYEDTLKPLRDFEMSDQYVKKYADNGLSMIISTNILRKKYGTTIAYFNNPCISENVFYVTGINFKADIGDIWCYDKYGFCKHRLYSLNPVFTLEDIIKILEQSNDESILGYHIVNNHIVMYTDTNPMM